MSKRGVIIIGGGVTGLASGLVSGLPVYEMAQSPGGICASYYLVPGSGERVGQVPGDGEAYRFEIGGGHWLWGGDPLILRFLESLSTFKPYRRRAAVYLPDRGLSIPYPIQNHLSYLGPSVARQALHEMITTTQDSGHMTTMADWLRVCFGPTLCEIFFGSFHDLYTAGLWTTIAPQDELKSPVNISMALQGAFNHIPTELAGYNVSFLYPTGGLNVVAQRMAERCNIQYEQQVMQICTHEKSIVFSDGTAVPYKTLLSTMPLNKTLRMAGLTTSIREDPFTSVMVVNIGAVKGPHCPTEHWIYIPNSKAGFHRVGFYSNVDSSFLPISGRESVNRTSLYVEKAYVGGQRPGVEECKALTTAVVQELQSWDWIGDVEVVDPTWVETAYTWTWPNSQWRQEALRHLQENDIYQLGRYGRWAPKVTDQGIAQSIRDGLCAGASFKE